jgi:hypothetical protein
MPPRQLSWQQGFSLSRKPVKRSTPRKKRVQQFEFIVERPSRDYRARTSLSIATLTDSGYLANYSEKHSTILDECTAYSQDETVQDNGPSIGTPLWAPSYEPSIRNEGYPGLYAIDGTAKFCLNSCKSKDQFAFSCSPESTTNKQPQVLETSNFGLSTSRNRSSQVAATRPSPETGSALVNIPCPASTSVPPIIEHGSLSQRFKPILNRCGLYLHIVSLATAY